MFVKLLSCAAILSMIVNSFKRSITRITYTRRSLTKRVEVQNFIRQIIESDKENGKNGGRVLTRFPPEPNGYLHLGHAKSVHTNFGLAKAFGGVTNLRFDDTNPEKEDVEYVNSIKEDVAWLLERDNPWDGKIRFASEYFPIIYKCAEYLIKRKLAYVDNLSAEEISQHRGLWTESGKESPFRNRPVEENLDLFRKMKEGAFGNGHCALRAKIDMSSPNTNMRDPVIYRIKHAHHPITKDAWCIYPTYDFAHVISDALEGITHSLCSLEFMNHRPLYDWILDQLLPSGMLPFKEEGWRPQQIEFARLNLQYTIMSKRKLIELVRSKTVEGWDDPRMPTISGVRRRGYPPQAIKLFCEKIGLTRSESVIDLSVLEGCVREVLEDSAPRMFAVMRPLRVTITNWEKSDWYETLAAENHPKYAAMGKRDLHFGRHLFIERDDFFDCGANNDKTPPAGFKRLLLKGTVRLKYGFTITCDEVMRNAAGEVQELRCSYDADRQVKAKGIIQWLSDKDAEPAQLRLYDRLFNAASPGKSRPDENFMLDLNPKSVEICDTALIERSAIQARGGHTIQFERLGFFVVDDKASTSRKVFNRAVTLKDAWAAAQSKDGASKSVDSSNAAPMAVEDIRRLDLRVGHVISAEKHPDADSLYVQKIDCGDASGPRTVLSGLVRFMDPQELIGSKVVVLCNLKPMKMRGILSEGMVLAASSADKSVVELVRPPSSSQPGDRIWVKGFDKPVPDAMFKSKSDMEVWPRVMKQLVTNENLQASFGQADNVMVCKDGPCVVKGLRGAYIH